MTLVEEQNLFAQIAIGLCTESEVYSKLALTMTVLQHHCNTPTHLSAVTGQLSNQLDDKYMTFIGEHNEVLNTALDHSRDNQFTYFAYKTLLKNYLLRNEDGQVIERPQHMFMRVACAIHLGNIERVLETYHMLSTQCFIHATPTLYNAGTRLQQLSSCYLMNIPDDSVDGIFTAIKQCAIVSKHAGGIGVSVSNIRGSGSSIRSTNGICRGVCPMLSVFNQVARYVDQGGKRKGAIAIYMEPWHIDLLDVLQLRTIGGDENVKTRDLFFGLMINDLFMERVKNNETWSLFCPSDCPDLVRLYGQEFSLRYVEYEETKSIRKKTFLARKIFQTILTTQAETGLPYILFKNAVNSKSNQQHNGTISTSNLCTEIVQFTSPEEIAVCNLASISLPSCVHDGVFDFKKLRDITRVVVRNLDTIIDINHYPLPEANHSNIKHRPMGVGVQGLADVFMKLRLPFESKEAQDLNVRIFAHIYYAALYQSCELAKESGVHPSYIGSPASHGQLQFDMWNTQPLEELDWKALKDDIILHGLRNSLLTTIMPTASTGQILGNTECIEPIHSNIFLRRTLAGEFLVINKYLIQDLQRLQLWSTEMKQSIIQARGSIQHIQTIPVQIRELYKTVWEMDGRTLINMAADRGVYIDQSQSLNVHMTNVSLPKLYALHFYTWTKGLKTGMYYLRSMAATQPLQITIPPEPVCKACEG
jgi:ribonucleoside-diphosphate reductase alpha chain